MYFLDLNCIQASTQAGVCVVLGALPFDVRFALGHLLIYSSFKYTVVID